MTVIAKRQGARVQTVLLHGGEVHYTMTVYGKDQPKILWQDSKRFSQKKGKGFLLNCLCK